MRLSASLAHAALIVATVLHAGCGRSVVGPGGRVADGVWGSAQGAFTVTTAGAHLELACASGEISQPLTVDDQNAFTVDGVFLQQVGPVQTQGQPARFSGRIEKQTMNLTITLANSHEAMGPFTFIYKMEVAFKRCQ